MRARPAAFSALVALPLLALLAASAPRPAARAAQTARAPAASEDAVQAADRALAAAVAGHDREAFGALVEDDAVFLGSRASRGREAILAAWAPFFAPGGPTLEWAPTEGHAAASGELAYTVGEYTLTLPGHEGAEPTVDRGRYVTVWSRGAEGRWRVALDGSLAASRSAAIEAALAGRAGFAPGAGWTVSWRPAERVLRSAAGGLAVALGDYELRVSGEGGAETVLDGTGFQVWTREGDGPWKAVLSSLTPPRPAQ
jgi:uncharacterized protein (TIGR02246 family)